MESPTVSVIIPTKDRPELLRRCIQPLLKEAHQVVVVLDGHNDASHPMLEELAPHHANLSFDVASGGRSWARQRGIEMATGDVVLLIDDDVVVASGTVDGHGLSHAVPNRVTVGYMPVKDPASVFSRLYAVEYENTCAKYERDADNVLAGLWGGNVSLDRSDALRVGLISDGFEQRYHEDTDFGLRCRAAGLTGHFDRTLRADHHHVRELKAFLRDARSQGEARVLLLERYGDASSFALSSAGWRRLGSHFTMVAILTALLSSLLGLPRTATPVAKLLRRLHRGAGEAAMQRKAKP